MALMFVKNTSLTKWKTAKIFFNVSIYIKLYRFETSLPSDSNKSGSHDVSLLPFVRSSFPHSVFLLLALSIFIRLSASADGAARRDTSKAHRTTNYTEGCDLDDTEATPTSFL